MKKINVLTATLVAASFVGFGIFAVAREKTVERKGVVQQILMNPEGDADGLLLEDGTQVHFPPHMSAELRKTVTVKDAVTIQGVSDGAKVFRAKTIENTQSKKSITDIPPHEMNAKGLMPAPPPAPPGPRAKPGSALTLLTAQGQISKQLFGPRGDVNGVILNDGAIIHVGPRVLDNSKVNLAPGQQLRAIGYGTKNEFGQSFEATDLGNN